MRIVTSQMCPLKQLCAPNHGCRGWKIRGPGLGGLHNAAVDQVKQLGVAMARRTGQEDQEATRHLFQRVSLSLMKGNAALFLARSLDEDQMEPRVHGRE